MRITSKGQVTIPQEIRERFGLLPDTEVEFVAKGNSVQIVKAKNPARPGRGEAIVSRLRGRGSVKMSTDQILALTRK
ncbi:MAG: AbrB/MazE/SpoVT family DNA-binding domain-containing protein [Thermoanaerobaculia bacterium]|jgi:AbrB family looped-hinge helix DNA binding protein